MLSGPLARRQRGDVIAGDDEAALRRTLKAGEHPQ